MWLPQNIIADVERVARVHYVGVADTKLCPDILTGQNDGQNVRSCGHQGDAMSDNWALAFMPLAVFGGMALVIWALSKW